MKFEQLDIFGGATPLGDLPKPPSGRRYKTMQELHGKTEGKTCKSCAHLPSEYEPKGDDMKTRENELHEPKIETEKWSTTSAYLATAYCPVCGMECNPSSLAVRKSKQDAIDRALKFVPNYCPNCGARLKEVNEI